MKRKNKQSYFLNYMVDLSPQTERNLLGIDSFPRAIVYSAFLLRRVYLSLEDDRVKSLITISPNVEFRREETIAVNSSLVIRASFNFSSSILQSMSDYFSSLIPISGSATYSGSPLIPTQDAIALIVPDIPEVDNLEKYFLWSVFKYQEDILVNNRLESSNSIQIDDRYQSTNDIHTQVVTARIPFYYLHFLQTRSYLESVGLRPPPDPVAGDFDTFFINENVIVDSSENFIVI